MNAPNWWIDANGRNTLRGDPDDPENLPILMDEFIIDSYHRSAQARADFNRMLPSMLPGEQVRLRAILSDNAYLVRPLESRSADERFQTAMNRIPVYTAGPGFRGQGYRRNALKNTYLSNED